MPALLMLMAIVPGIDVGWRPADGGGTEYILQIEPDALRLLRPGDELASDLPPWLDRPTTVRIVIGDAPLPRELPTEPSSPADSFESPEVNDLLGPDQGPAIDRVAVLPGPGQSASRQRQMAAYPPEPQRFVPRRAAPAGADRTTSESAAPGRALRGRAAFDQERTGDATLRRSSDESAAIDSTSSDRELPDAAADAIQPQAPLRIIRQEEDFRAGAPDGRDASARQRAGPSEIGDRSPGGPAPGQARDTRPTGAADEPSGEAADQDAQWRPGSGSGQAAGVSSDESPQPDDAIPSGQNQRDPAHAPGGAVQPIRPRPVMQFPSGADRQPAGDHPDGSEPEAPVNARSALNKHDRATEEPDSTQERSEGGQSPPAQSAAAQPPATPSAAAMPGWTVWSIALVGLFASLSGNCYLGWLAVDLRRRYLAAVRGNRGAEASGRSGGLDDEG